MKLDDAVVLEHSACGAGYRLLLLRAPAVAPVVAPGQFVHVQVPGLDGAVLRRPFSVYRADGDRLGILYKVVGRGTAVLAGAQPGARLSVIGPLGNGFPLDPGAGRLPVLVAGGYGVAPLSLLAARLPAPGAVFIGGATAADLLCVGEFGTLGWEVHLATEDGSRGVTGRVTVALDAWLETAPAGVVFYACGPDGLLRAVGDRALARGEKAWLSLDKHMGCGVGACLACVQRIREADGTEAWKRVCRDGPVFEAREVVWDAPAPPAGVARAGRTCA